MKKILSMVLALAMMLTAAAAFAEAPAEESGLSSLLGTLLSGSDEGSEGSGLSSLLGSLMGKLGSKNFSLSSLLKPLLKKLGTLKGVRLSELIGALKQKLSGLLGGITKSADAEGSEDAGLSSLLGLLSGVTGESDGTESGESFDLSSLLGLLGGGAGESGIESVSGDDLAGLLGLLAGDESGDDFDFDAFLEEFRSSPEYQEYIARWDARKAYLNERYADLEKGDEQIVIVADVTNFDNIDPNVEFGSFVLANYKVDGKDLKFMNSEGDVLLLNYEKQEDGTYKVGDVMVAEKGDGFDASIQSMCEAFGATLDDYNEHVEMEEYEGRDCLRDFLREHPEYERIEYNGEMKSLEDLDAIQDAYWKELDMELGIESAE